MSPVPSAPRTITEAQWRARLAQWPDGVVPPHFTLDGQGPKYLTDADLVTVTEASECEP